MAHPEHVQIHDDFEAAVDKLPIDLPLAVALADLDGFGPLNDQYGREAADTVIDSFHRTLSGSLPADAVVARIGGDEFAVALPDTTPESALILIEEVRAHFSSRPASREVPLHVAVSAGIAARPPHATAVIDLLKAADEALHRAKREGGGRVAIYVEEKMVLKSNYYPRAALDRLAKLSDRTGRTEASLLREALDDVFGKYRGLL